MNKPYFAYIRVSTVKQGERGSSLVEQRSAIEAYANRNTLQISRWFEEMETAAKHGRRAFSAMLAELKRGKAVGLIIHKIDRSARNLRDWADLGDLIDRGIDVRFVTDNFDLLSRGGRLSADIQAVVAADFIRNLRDEVRKGVYGRLKQGLYPFGAPMGYLNTGKAKSKIIDPVKGPLVKYLFERYATNAVGFHDLRAEMHVLGLSTPSGKPLYPRSLTSILHNPFYAGVIKLGTTGETFAGIHEPLIQMALFERVQAILHGKTVPRAKKHRFLLRQLVKCSSCNRRTLTGELQKGAVYYRCHVCPGVSWKGKTLEAVALEHMSRVSLDVRGLGDFRDVRDVVAGTEGEDTKRIQASLSLRLQHLDDRLTRLTDLVVDKAIDLSTFTHRKEKLLVEQQRLREELTRTEIASPFQDLCAEFELRNNELLRYDSLLDDEKRELLQTICSNFSVSSKNVTITLRTPYKEIAEIEQNTGCEPRRNDLRTKRIVEILRQVAESGNSPPRSP